LNPKLLLTGASGFIGKNIIPILKKNYEIQCFSFRTDPFVQLDLDGIKAIVFLSGLAHQSGDIPSGEYDRVNHLQAVQLAKAAKEKKVGQFIYLSSVKVYGDDVQGPFDEESACKPTDAYGISKWKAEQNLLALADETFKVSIIRPPLVYGPGVKANMKALVNLVLKWPILPLGNIRNQRSMVYTGNLVALIEKLLHESRTGVFIAGDQKLHSTTELVQTISKLSGTKKWILPLPEFIQKAITAIKPETAKRIFGSFVIDNKNTNNKLGFKPPYSFEEGIRAMVLNTDQR
jgi:UDP-glucose 4-epimerase